MVKQEKKITVVVLKDPLQKFRGDVLVLGLFQKTTRVPEELKGLDRATGGALSDWLKLKDFSGKVNETAVVYLPAKSPCKRVLLVGLGDKKELKLDVFRQAAGTAVRRAEKLNTSRVGMALHAVVDSKWDLETAAQAMTEGAIVGRYEYQDYMTGHDNGQVQAMRVSLIESKAGAVLKMNRGRKKGIILAGGQNRMRSVANMPGNEINPPSLGRLAQKLARQFGLKCKVMDEKQLAAKKMNGILAVGSGSSTKPRLIQLEYNGRRGNKAADGPDAIVVGKAVTFDSGGISIKPSANMEAMKFDKSGGCAVLGIMTAVAELKLPIRVVGLIPSAENMPSGSSYRPGDIVRTHSGKTVEVQNTDAEGRMILCDALAYGAKMKPKAIIDMATLTGACVIALGEHYAGLFSNNEPLRQKLEAASQVSGEAVWHLPCGPEYLEQMKSKVADLKNVGGREGGSCTAAAFLGAFVGDVPWAHIDIAGTADTTKEKSYRSSGSTGMAVRLVLEYLCSLKK